MKKINFLLICALLAICSCSEEDVLITQEEQAFTAGVDSSFFRSESDAVFSAMKTFSELYPNDKRVSHRSESLMVKNVNRIKSNNQSSLNAPGFYIVNFEDGGFVMVSNDTRATEVYAYSDEGSLSQGANDGVDYFLESANDYLNYEVANSNRISILPIIPIPDPDDPSNYALVEHDGHYCHQVPVSETTSGSLEYLLSSKWHQEEPYNNLCLNSSGGTVSAGCVPIALGQIMAYHQKPASYNGHTYSWESINLLPIVMPGSSAAQSVAELINDIGVTLGINYKGGDTGASINDAYNALDDFGYNRSLSDYSFSTITSNIDLNRPCFVCGFDNSSEGHAWVIDGYRSTSTTYKYYHQSSLEYCSTVTKTDSYVHCNWGWSGDHDGFYLSKVFNNYEYPPIYDNSSNSDTTFNYSNNLKMIYNIYQ